MLVRQKAGWRRITHRHTAGGLINKGCTQYGAHPMIHRQDWIWEVRHQPPTSYTIRTQFGQDVKLGKSPQAIWVCYLQPP